MKKSIEQEFEDFLKSQEEKEKLTQDSEKESEKTEERCPCCFER